jgi:HD-like signal output (HDOD) protein
MLTDSNLRSFVSQLKSLPSVPSTYLELVETARNPDVSVAQLGRIISKDLAMAAKVVQLANSPFFGIREEF